MREATARAWAGLFASHGRIHVYTVDPGGHAMAQQLVPLIRDGGRLGDWFAEGWSARHVPGCRPGGELPDALESGDTLLMGSQVTYDRTHAVLRGCAERRAATIFVFDHWKNYAAHFGAGPLPDVVVVPDEDGRDGLVSTYGDAIASRIRILPHAAIEAAVDRIRALQMSVERGTIAMLLDPTDLADGLGYDWRRELHAAVVHAAAGAFARLLVKPHPRQDLEAVRSELQRIEANGVTVQLYAGETEPLIAVAEEVWGMTTVGLNIAISAGKRIRSFQVGRNAAGIRASNRKIEPYVIDALPGASS
jgi:hypothetical protein